ncbi:hypothetical protein Pan258_02170 [Symmachiella dynata]|nr:hypothetical protein Pan258_02170 [Symmachiella dynata]
MAVPEATVYEHDGSISCQNYIGFSGQVRSMQPESKTHRMQQPTHNQFRPRVF